jgi:hypothetical protein
MAMLAAIASEARECQFEAKKLLDESFRIRVAAHDGLASGEWRAGSPSGPPSGDRLTFTGNGDKGAKRNR